MDWVPGLRGVPIRHPPIPGNSENQYRILPPLPCKSCRDRHLRLFLLPAREPQEQTPVCDNTLSALDLGRRRTGAERMPRGGEAAGLSFQPCKNPRHAYHLLMIALNAHCILTERVRPGHDSDHAAGVLRPIHYPRLRMCRASRAGTNRTGSGPAPPSL